MPVPSRISCYINDYIQTAAAMDETQELRFSKLNDRLEEWEMKGNWQKTRVMRIGRKKGASAKTCPYE